MFQENKACQVFRKANISYPLIPTRTCAYQGVTDIRFSENVNMMVVLGIAFTSISSFSNDALMRLTSIETLLRLVFTKLFCKRINYDTGVLTFIHYYFNSTET